MESKFNPALSDLPAEVLLVLQKGAQGRGESPHNLTSYQILNRLPAQWREWLQKTYGPSGKNANNPDSGASRVAQAAVQLAKQELVAISYIDTGGIKFYIESEGDVTPGYSVCALYRAV